MHAVESESPAPQPATTVSLAASQSPEVPDSVGAVDERLRPGVVGRGSAYSAALTNDSV